jgi:hypothetical protein
MKAENTSIPAQSKDHKDVIEMLKEFKELDPDWKGGKTWGTRLLR